MRIILAQFLRPNAFFLLNRVAGFDLDQVLPPYLKAISDVGFKLNFETDAVVYFTAWSLPSLIQGSKFFTGDNDSTRRTVDVQWPIQPPTGQSRTGKPFSSNIRNSPTSRWNPFPLSRPSCGPEFLAACRLDLPSARLTLFSKSHFTMVAGGFVVSAAETPRSIHATSR